MAEWNFLHVVLIVLSITIGILAARRFGALSPGPTGLLSTAAVRWFTLPRSLLLFAIVLGAALRFYGLQFGLPQPFHPDELQKAHFLNQMMRSGTVNPHFSLQPPLLLYFSWGMSIVLKFLGFFPEDAIARNLLAGRTVNALFGIASLPLLYACGRRLFNSELTGAVAALFLAVAPLHVTNSRYMKEDVIFLTFVLACLLALLKAVDTKRLGYLYLAGLLAGISVGSKYTGIVSIALILGSPWLLSPEMKLVPAWRWLGHALLAALLMPIGFLLTVPYAILDPDQLAFMFEGFRNESHHAMNGHMGLKVSAGSQLWMFHFSRSIIPGFGLIPTVIGLFGCGLAIWRWQSRGLFVVALVLLFYLPAEWALSKPPPQPDRYVLACVPFLALLTAEFIVTLTAAYRGRSPVVQPLLLVLIAAAFPLFQTIAYASEIRDDTRLLMRSWIAQNVPAGKRVILMGGSTYLPRVPLSIESTPARKVIGRSKVDVIRRLRESGYDYLLITSPSPKRFSIRMEERAGGSRSGVRQALQEIEASFPVVQEYAPKFGTYGFHNPTLRLFDLHAAVGAPDHSN